MASRRMSIPPLLPLGFLPPGIHNTTVPEIENVFGSSNQTRIDLFSGLTRYADLLKSVGLFSGIYVDGSFVTDKALPGDIDVVVDMDIPSFVTLLGRPNRAAVMDPFLIKATYGLHLFFSPTDQGIINFFQHLRPEEAIMRKVPISTMRGILRVPL
jgi:uncharacterized protein DUF6932